MSYVLLVWTKTRQGEEGRVAEARSELAGATTGTKKTAVHRGA
jgi:hypothetical protein